MVSEVQSAGSRNGDVEDSYPADMIRTGERVKQCPITGDEYLVTKWAVKLDGRIIPLEKDLVDDE